MITAELKGGKRNLIENRIKEELALRALKCQRHITRKWRLTANGHSAGFRLQQTCNQRGKRGLSRSRRTGHHKDIASMKREIQPPQDATIPIRESEVANGKDDIAVI